MGSRPLSYGKTFSSLYESIAINVTCFEPFTARSRLSYSGITNGGRSRDFEIPFFFFLAEFFG